MCTEAELYLIHTTLCCQESQEVVPYIQTLALRSFQGTLDYQLLDLLKPAESVVMKVGEKNLLINCAIPDNLYESWRRTCE